MMMEDENFDVGEGRKPKAAKGAKKAVLGAARTINGRTVEETYQKKTQLEHILLRPDTYVGSCERVTQPMWVYSEADDKVVRRSITFTPGLYKIFDEIVVNAADNKQRDESMDRLEVTIDAANGTISVWNNGRGVPIAIHQKHDCYVPELIFGNLLTGSNFDDDEKKTTGGRNGYGAKLANIFSTEFVVETADRSVKRKYTQTFSDNMQAKEEPVIEKYTGDDFTCITFKPDWARFKMDGLDADTVALLMKRVYDMAACMGMSGGTRVKVSLNGRKLPVKKFQDYLGIFEGLEPPVVFEQIGDGRWEVGIAPSDGSFQQVSYVNAICTTKGGTHITCIADQVAAGLAKAVQKRNNKDEVKGHHIKNHIAVYVNALVENPAFDSQTKETLTTRISDFGSVPKLSAEALKKLEKSSIVDAVVSWAKFKQTQQLGRKSGKKASKLTGVPKLDDANFAGTARSQECTLILTEGDSAKTLAVSGLGVVGRDLFGVFPLKGKLLNVRDTSMKAVSNNEEVCNIVRIMGLKYGQEYTDTKSLRYGHLMIMTDQDHDGSHIKGLLINFVHHFWPSLLKIPGFLQEFITPIVKATKGSREECFYTMPDFETWKASHNDGRGWTTKYYKGLGTSTAKEAKSYFAAIDIHLLDFSWEDDRRDSDLIDMVFSKKRAEDRKRWLAAVKPGTSVSYDVDAMSYDAFVNQELVLFSAADTARSIPCLVDGLKPSQRKVLFGCFKRRLTSEVKVAQLAGYVSEHAAYHHGEASLNSTIVGMAQSFVGSNNMHLLAPGGQFGTRLMGGKDAASTRYIFTRLEKLARAVFHPDDDALLAHLEDDGTAIEPTYYVPVLPMVLVNGSQGIGTGWSSDVPNFCPRDVVQNLRRRIAGKPMVIMQPWYRGFTGTIEPKATRKEPSYVSRGIIKRTSEEQVLITELPLKKWTQDYKQFLESLLPGAESAAAKGKDGKAAAGKKKPAGTAAAAGGRGKKKAAADEPEEEAKESSRPHYNIKDFRENHTDTTVSFLVTMAQEHLDAIEAASGGLHKFFKLESSLSTSNMMLFNANGHIHKYSSPLQIIEDFFGLRLDFYARRKRHLLGRLQQDWRRLDNRVRFVLAVVEKRLEVSNRKKKELLAELAARGFDAMPPEAKVGAKVAGAPAGLAPAEEEESVDVLTRGYDYLLGMKLWSLTLEKVKQLEAELEGKSRELEALKATSPEQLWIRDLDVIEELLDESDAALARDAALEMKQRGKAEQNQRKGGGGASKQAVRARAKAAAAARSRRLKGDGNEDSDAEVFSEDDDDFEKVSSKKKRPGAAKKAAAATAPASTPVLNAIGTTLGLSADGAKVSVAFAAAEANGDVVMSSAELPYVGKNSANSGGGGTGEDGDLAECEEDILPEHAGHYVPEEKDKPKMSLADRLKLKMGSDGIGILEEKKPLAKAKAATATGAAKKAPARKKKEAFIKDESELDSEEGSDGSDSDLDSAAPPAPRAVSKRSAAAVAEQNLKRVAAQKGKAGPKGGSDEDEDQEGEIDDEDAEVFDAGSESEEDEDDFDDEDEAPKAKNKARGPAKTAAKPAKAKAVVSDAFAMSDSEDDVFVAKKKPLASSVAAKPRAKAAAPKAKSAAAAPTGGKGVKRPAKSSSSANGGVSKKEPPAKRMALSKKVVEVDSSDEDDADASVAVSVKPVSRTRRGGGKAAAVKYAAIAESDAEGSDAAGAGEETDSD